MLSLFVITAICCCQGCKKKDSTPPPPASPLAKMTGMRVWHVSYQYGYSEPNKIGSGTSVFHGTGGFLDTFSLVIKSDSEVAIYNNKPLSIDTSVFALRMKDSVCWQFVLTRNVVTAPHIITPYNRYPDSLQYYPAKDSMRLFSWSNSGTPYANYVFVVTP